MLCGPRTSESENGALLRETTEVKRDTTTGGIMLGRHIISLLAIVFVHRGSVDAAGSTTSNNDLVCYQCQSKSLEECRKMKYLKTCPDDQAYDRCETIIEKKGPHENATVTKKCSLAPCQLESFGLIDRSCDMSKDSYVCVSCCKQNMCNGSGRLEPAAAVYAAAALVAAAAAAVAANAQNIGLV